MGTFNDTWDCYSVSDYIHLSKQKHPVSWKLFFHMLGLESYEAMEMAKENKQHEPAIKKKLKSMVKEYIELRKLLKLVSKKSYKF